MLPVPGVPVQSSIATGAAQPVRTLWVMKTEVSWDLYDVFVFGFDQPEDRRGTTNAADAFARPSKPYVLPGDAFGHKGYPALGMSLLAAKEFAKWLSARTGRPYRLPTEAEWVHICRAGQGATAGDSARGGAPRGSAAGTAGVWHAANSKEQTQPVGTLPPDALGVHDMLGNAAEWVVAGTDSVVMGGAWDSEPSDVSCTASRRQSPAWNVSDPQLPKSRWWLTDAFFVGLRLVRDQ
jgi:formylglycine-generating enzyme required for sulfatase activity